MTAEAAEAVVGCLVLVPMGIFLIAMSVAVVLEAWRDSQKAVRGNRKEGRR